MKSFIVLAMFVAAAVAAPAAQSSDSQATIIQQKHDNIGVGPYETSFETSNGISRNEVGQLTDEGISARGQYSFPGPDGVLYTVTWVADKDGFRPSGAHLPV